MRYNCINTPEIELSSVITDIAAGPFGSNLKVSCFVPDGFPIIDGANLKGYKVTDNITKFVTDEKAHSIERSIAHRGDVVCTISGTLGQIAYIPDDSKYDGYLCSQRQFRITFDKTKVYVPYIVFYFHTYEGQHKILSFASQVGVPALSQPLKNFRKIKLQLPEYQEQIRIAKIVEGINNKIETNEKINDNLLQQLSSIYFLMFYKSSRNDTSMVPVSKICTYSQRRVPVTSLTLENYYSTENMLPGKAGAVTATSLPSISQTTGCKPGDVLISNIRPYFKKIIYCQTECGCSTDVLCFVPDTQELSLYLFCTLFDDRFFEYMVAGSKGTKMPRGDKQQIMAYCIPNPSTNHLKEFNTIAHPIMDKIDAVKQENKRLTLLRDTLLPRLMSGEIDVSGISI